MLEQFLDGSNYYEFPSFEVAVYSLLLALVLSAAIAITYKFTYRGKDFPNHLFQAMILSAIVTSMIMMAIGNNLAIGIGIIGVVAIIRFRTVFRNTRNIIFIFAALSTGIATGVYGYAIALAGTGVFCLTAILLYYSPYGRNSVTVNRLEFLIGEGQDIDAVMTTLRSFMHRESLIEVRDRPNGTLYDYRCEILDPYNWNDIQQALRGKVDQLRIREMSKEESV